MFIAPGIRGQTQLDDLMDFSGVIAAGGTAQLVLPQQPRRASLFIANLSTLRTLTVGLGPATALATVTSNAVASIAVVNGGIGYTTPPRVRILGGVVDGDYQNAPQHPAVAHATLTAGAVSAITVDDPGAGYNYVPLIYLENPLPTLGGGAKLPSATVGIPLPPGWTFSTSGMIVVPSSAVAVFTTTTSDPYEIKVGGLV